MGEMNSPQSSSFLLLLPAMQQAHTSEPTHCRTSCSWKTRNTSTHRKTDGKQNKDSEQTFQSECKAS